ncbi:MAG: hypothetical protein ACK5KQ_05720 [Anaerorhabdus sp.]
MNDKWKQLDKISISDKHKEEVFDFVVKNTTKTKKLHQRLIVPLISSLACLVLVFYGFNSTMVNTSAASSSVAIETSSLLILELDKNQVIQSFDTSSFEDEKALHELGIIGSKLENVVEQIIESTAKKDEDVNIYVYSVNKEHSSKLNSTLNELTNTSDKISNNCHSQTVDKNEFGQMKDRKHNKKQHH